MPDFSVEFNDGYKMTVTGDSPPTNEEWVALRKHAEAQESPVKQPVTAGERIGAVAEEAAGQAAPAVAGLAAAGQVGLATAPLGPFVSIPAAVIAGFAASAGTQWLQDTVSKGVMGDDAFNEMMDKIRQRREEMPVSTAIGQFAPQLLAMKFNPKNVAEAIKDSKQLLGGAKAFNEWAANPANASRVANMMNVGIGAAVPAGVSTLQELTDDKEGISGVKIATDVLAGAFLNDPTKFGHFIMGSKPMSPIQTAFTSDVPRSDDFFLKSLRQEVDGAVSGKQATPAITAAG